MEISHLRIRDVRALRDLKLDFSISGVPRRRTVLVGLNGAGKTTILDSLVHVYETLRRAGGADSALSGQLLGADDIRNDDSAVIGSISQRTGSIDATIKLSQQERRVSPRVKEATGVVTFDVGNPYDYVVDSPPIQTVDIVAESTAGDDTPDESTDVDHRFKHRAERAVSVARTFGALLPASRGVLAHHDDLLLAEVTGATPRPGPLSRQPHRFRALGGLLSYRATHADAGERLDRLWKILARCFPDMPTFEAVHRGELWFRTSAKALVPLHKLSDGQRAVLLILGELASYPSPPSMVLIDEPEQHLHPGWQTALLDAVASVAPAAQVFMATQSPYLAASCPEDVIKIGPWPYE